MREHISIGAQKPRNAKTQKRRIHKKQGKGYGKAGLRIMREYEYAEERTIKLERNQRPKILILAGNPSCHLEARF